MKIPKEIEYKWKVCGWRLIKTDKGFKWEWFEE